MEAAQRDQLAAADRHSADMKLLDGQPVRPPRWDDLTARLGCSPLAKALKVSTQIQVRIFPQHHAASLSCSTTWRSCDLPFLRMRA